MIKDYEIVRNYLLRFEMARGVQYVLIMMGKCIMVKIWEAKSRTNNENRGNL